MCAQLQTSILYNQQIFIPQLLPDYDSVVFIPDTTPPVQAYLSGSIMREVNGDIKSMNVFKEDGTLLEVSIGTIQNNTTNVFTYSAPLGPQDTLFNALTLKNKNNQDSVITYLDNTGMGISFFQRLLMSYTSSGQRDHLLMQLANAPGQAFQTYFDFKFFYSNNRLDSVQRTDFFPNPAINGKLIYYYDTQGALTEVEVYERNSPALTVSSKFIPVLNQQNEVIELLTVQYNSGLQQFEFQDLYKFYRNNGQLNIREHLNETSVNIYPNPAKDKLNIDTEVAFDFYEIISLKGQLIKSGELKGSWLSIENLNAGTYLLKLQNDSHNRTIRFQKQ
jgi:CMP-N-acetylneuraminic acid synthetase